MSAPGSSTPDTFLTNYRKKILRFAKTKGYDTAQEFVKKLGDIQDPDILDLVMHGTGIGNTVPAQEPLGKTAKKNVRAVAINSHTSQVLDEKSLQNAIKQYGEERIVDELYAARNQEYMNKNRQYDTAARNPKNHTHVDISPEKSQNFKHDACEAAAKEVGAVSSNFHAINKMRETTIKEANAVQHNLRPIPSGFINTMSNFNGVVNIGIDHLKAMSKVMGSRAKTKPSPSSKISSSRQSYIDERATNTITTKLAVEELGAQALFAEFQRGMGSVVRKQQGRGKKSYIGGLEHINGAVLANVLPVPRPSRPYTQKVLKKPVQNTIDPKAEFLRRSAEAGRELQRKQNVRKALEKATVAGKRLQGQNYLRDLKASIQPVSKPTVVHTPKPRPSVPVAKQRSSWMQRNKDRLMEAAIGIGGTAGLVGVASSALSGFMMHGIPMPFAKGGSPRRFETGGITKLSDGQIWAQALAGGWKPRNIKPIEDSNPNKYFENLISNRLPKHARGGVPGLVGQMRTFTNRSTRHMAHQTFNDMYLHQSNDSFRSMSDPSQSGFAAIAGMDSGYQGQGFSLSGLGGWFQQRNWNLSSNYGHYADGGFIHGFESGGETWNNSLLQTSANKSNIKLQGLREYAKLKQNAVYGSLLTGNDFYMDLFGKQDFYDERSIAPYKFGDDRSYLPLFRSQRRADWEHSLSTNYGLVSPRTLTLIGESLTNLDDGTSARYLPNVEGQESPLENRATLKNINLGNLYDEAYTSRRYKGKYGYRLASYLRSGEFDDKIYNDFNLAIPNANALEKETGVKNIVKTLDDMIYNYHKRSDMTQLYGSHFYRGFSDPDAVNSALDSIENTGNMSADPAYEFMSLDPAISRYFAKNRGDEGIMLSYQFQPDMVHNFAYRGNNELELLKARNIGWRVLKEHKSKDPSMHLFSVSPNFESGGSPLKAAMNLSKSYAPAHFDHAKKVTDLALGMHENLGGSNKKALAIAAIMHDAAKTKRTAPIHHDLAKTLIKKSKLPVKNDVKKSAANIAAHHKGKVPKGIPKSLLRNIAILRAADAASRGNLKDLPIRLSKKGNIKVNDLSGLSKKRQAKIKESVKLLNKLEGKATGGIPGFANGTPRKVGKFIGGSRYVHTSALDSLESDLLERIDKSKSVLPKDFNYNVVKIGVGKKDKGISFINSPDFDTNTEPISGDSYKVKEDLSLGRLTKQKPDPDIYHHKWMMVNDDYKGFDVSASKARSQWWTSHPAFSKIQEGNTKVSSLIGKQSVWNNITSALHGVDSGKMSLDDVYNKFEIKGSQRPGNTSIPQVSRGLKFIGDNFPVGSKVLDYGGGKFDIGMKYLMGKGMTPHVYDPDDSRPQWYKDWALSQNYDVVGLNNVLNVINDEEIRKNVIQSAFDRVKKGGSLVATMYEGPKRDGIARKTPSGQGEFNWQLNRKTASYKPEIENALKFEIPKAEDNVFNIKKFAKGGSPKNLIRVSDEELGLSRSIVNRIGLDKLEYIRTLSNKYGSSAIGMLKGTSIPNVQGAFEYEGKGSPTGDRILEDSRNVAYVVSYKMRKVLEGLDKVSVNGTSGGIRSFAAGGPEDSDLPGFANGTPSHNRTRMSMKDLGNAISGGTQTNIYDSMHIARAVSHLTGNQITPRSIAKLSGSQIQNSYLQRNITGGVGDTAVYNNAVKLGKIFDSLIKPGMQMRTMFDHFNKTIKLSNAELAAIPKKQIRRAQKLIGAGVVDPDAFLAVTRGGRLPPTGLPPGAGGTGGSGSVTPKPPKFPPVPPGLPPKPPRPPAPPNPQHQYQLEQGRLNYISNIQKKSSAFTSSGAVYKAILGESQFKRSMLPEISKIQGAMNQIPALKQMISNPMQFINTDLSKFNAAHGTNVSQGVLDVFQKMQTLLQRNIDSPTQQTKTVRNKYIDKTVTERDQFEMKDLLEQDAIDKANRKRREEHLGRRNQGADQATYNAWMRQNYGDDGRFELDPSIRNIKGKGTQYHFNDMPKYEQAAARAREGYIGDGSGVLNNSIFRNLRTAFRGSSKVRGKYDTFVQNFMNEAPQNMLVTSGSTRMKSSFAQRHPEATNAELKNFGTSEQIEQVKANLELQKGDLRRQMTEFLQNELGDIDAGKYLKLSFTDDVISENEDGFKEVSTSVEVGLEAMEKELKERYNLVGEDAKAFMEKFQDTFNTSIQVADPTTKKADFQNRTEQVKGEGFQSKNAMKVNKLAKDLSWKSASISMSSMGVYFSLMGVFMQLNGAVNGLMSSLSDLNGVFKNIGFVAAFGGGMQKVNEILGAAGNSQNDLVEGWKSAQAVQSSFALGMSSLAAAMFKDKDFMDKLIASIQVLFAQLSSEDLLLSFKDLILAGANALPALTDAIKMLIPLLQFVGKNPWLVTMAAQLMIITMLIQPLTSGISLLLAVIATGAELTAVFGGIGAGLSAIGVGLLTVTGYALLFALAIEGITRAYELLSGNKVEGVLGAVLHPVSTMWGGAGALAGGVGEITGAYSIGGEINGPSTTAIDDKLIRAEEGEFMVRKGVAQRNEGALRVLNATGKWPTGYSTGGEIGYGTVPANFNLSAISRSDKFYQTSSQVTALDNNTKVNKTTADVMKRSDAGDSLWVRIKGGLGLGDTSNTTNNNGLPFELGMINRLFNALSFTTSPITATPTSINPNPGPIAATTTNPGPIAATTTNPGPASATVFAVSVNPNPSPNTNPDTNPSTNPNQNTNQNPNINPNNNSSMNPNSVTSIIGFLFKGVQQSISTSLDAISESIGNGIEAISNSFDVAYTAMGKFKDSIGELAIAISNGNFIATAINQIKSAGSTISKATSNTGSSIGFNGLGKGAGISDIAYHSGWYRGPQDVTDYGPTGKSNGDYATRWREGIHTYGKGPSPMDANGKPKFDVPIKTIWTPKEKWGSDVPYDYGSAARTAITSGGNPYDFALSVASIRANNAIVGLGGGLLQRASLSAPALIARATGVNAAEKAALAAGTNVAEAAVGRKLLAAGTGKLLAGASTLFTGGNMLAGNPYVFAGAHYVEASQANDEFMKGRSLDDLKNGKYNAVTGLLTGGASTAGFAKGMEIWGSIFNKSESEMRDSMNQNSGFMNFGGGMIPGIRDFWDTTSTGAEKINEMISGTNLKVDIPVLGELNISKGIGDLYEGVVNTAKELSTLDVGTIFGAGTSAIGIGAALGETALNTGKIIAEDPLGAAANMASLYTTMGMPGLPIPGLSFIGPALASMILPNATNNLANRDYLGSSDLYGGASDLFNPEVLQAVTDSSVVVSDGFKKAAESSSSVGLMYDKQSNSLMTQAEALNLSAEQFRTLTPAVMDVNTGMVTFTDGMTQASSGMATVSQAISDTLSQVTAIKESSTAYLTNVNNLVNAGNAASEQGYQFAAVGMDTKEYTPSFVQEPQSVSTFKELLANSIAEQQAIQSQVSTPQEMNISISVSGSDKNEIASTVIQLLIPEIENIIRSNMPRV